MSNSQLEPLHEAGAILKDVSIEVFEFIPIAGKVISVLDKHTERIRLNARLNELESYNKVIRSKLSKKSNKLDEKFIQEILIFRLEDIAAKMLRYPNKGWDAILSEYVAVSATRFDFPPDSKSLILSTLLELDIIDLRVLAQIYISCVSYIRNNQGPGIKFKVLVELMKSAGFDSIMIERSIDRLQAQSLVKPFNTQATGIQNTPDKKDLLEGKRDDNFYSPSGYLYTTYGERFIRFLNLTDNWFFTANTF